MRNLTVLFVLAFLMSACGAAPALVQPVALLPDGSSMMATPTVEPTWTPIPEPTVDYPATVSVAETKSAQFQLDALHSDQTAVAAQVAIVTFTAGVEQSTALSNIWTATAAPTAIPKTETQSAVNQSNFQTQVVLEGLHSTQTVEAPTQIVRIANAEAEAQYAGAQKAADVVMTFGAAVFFLALAALIFWVMRRNPNGAPTASAAAQSAQPIVPINDYANYTRVNIARDTVGGQGQYTVIPISADDFDALAIGVSQYGLAVNQWDGTKRPSPFTASNKRDTILTIRAWLRSNGLAAENENTRQLALTPDGERFFDDWLRKGALPQNFNFSAEPTENHGVSAHAHDFHAHEKGADAVGGSESGGEEAEVEVIDPAPVRAEPMYHPIGLNARNAHN